MPNIVTIKKYLSIFFKTEFNNVQKKKVESSTIFVVLVMRILPSEFHVEVVQTG